MACFLSMLQCDVQHGECIDGGDAVYYPGGGATKWRELETHCQSPALMQVDILKEGWERKEEVTCTWSVTTLGLNTSLKQLCILFSLNRSLPWMYTCTCLYDGSKFSRTAKKTPDTSWGRDTFVYMYMDVRSQNPWISRKMLRVQAWEADLYHPAALNASSMPDTARHTRHKAKRQLCSKVGLILTLGLQSLDAWVCFQGNMVRAHTLAHSGFSLGF